MNLQTIASKITADFPDSEIEMKDDWISVRTEGDRFIMGSQTVDGFAIATSGVSDAPREQSTKQKHGESFPIRSLDDLKVSILRALKQ